MTAPDAQTGAPAEARFWQPVAAIDALAGVGGPPLPLRVLGQDIVLWRGAGGVAAFDDRCPHRGAALSLGQVVGGQLRCAYHGWRFDPTGRCVRVPSAPDFTPPPSHAARPWRVAQAHGLWWVARDPLDPAPPACAGVPARRVVCGPYDVQTSAPRLIENFLDTSHFAFVHEGWLGDAAHPEVPPYAVTHTADGRPLIPHYRAWQPRASASSAGGAWVDYRYEVLGPYAALLVKQPEGGGVADAYAAFACPVDEERCRAWFMQFTTDTVTPDAGLQQFQDTIFSQDRAVLESQRPRRLPLGACRAWGAESENRPQRADFLPASPPHSSAMGQEDGEKAAAAVDLQPATPKSDRRLGGEVHSAADRLSAAYRRWLDSVGVRFGVC